MSTAITVAQFIAEARKLVGTPYVHQGHNRYGVDCIGVLAASATNAGFDVLGFLESKNFVRVAYGRAASPLLLELVSKYAVRVPKPVSGSALLFKFPKEKYPSHFAILTDTNTIIHADGLRAKKVIEQTFGAPWTRLLHSCWQMLGVAYE